MDRREFLKLAAATVASLPVARRARTMAQFERYAPPEPNEPQRLHVIQQTQTTLGPTIVIPQDGVYHITGRVKWDESVEGPRAVSFLIDGRRFPLGGALGYEQDQAVSVIYRGEAMEWVQMQVYHRSRQHVVGVEGLFELNLEGVG